MIRGREPGPHRWIDRSKLLRRRQLVDRSVSLQPPTDRWDPPPREATGILPEEGSRRGDAGSRRATEEALQISREARSWMIPCNT